MELSSINPYNNELLATFQIHGQEEIDHKLNLSSKAFSKWRKTSLDDRSNLLNSVADNLNINRERLAKNISMEMGKPLTQALAEVDKCEWVCRYYAEQGPKFLENEVIGTDAEQSWVQYQPIGPVLAIMPWNYPFWQVFRFAAPAVMAGNTCLLKHASNVNLCARNIETLFNEAQAPDGLFQSLILSTDQVASIIANPLVKAVTLTGSEKAGSNVASIAGRNIKKSVLELGGSNAFVVLEDADLDAIIPEAVNGRFQNAGQSCIAAKRFILEANIEEAFMERFIEKVKSLVQGDPLLEDTEIGPMARTDLAEQLEDQVNNSIEGGAKLLLGGTRSAAHYQPTILSQVEPGMPAFDDELFGPVAAVTVVNEVDEALMMVNRSKYGLGATICTTDIEQANKFINGVDDGAVFVNAAVKSDPRLPFGGTKSSGYGRELSHYGLREFVNIKTVYIK